MARLSRTSKAQLTARAIFWAFDWDRKAREALDASAKMEDVNTAEANKLFDDYKRFASWRDMEMQNAFGMTYQQYHDFAFKPNGKLAALTTRTLRSPNGAIPA